MGAVIHGYLRVGNIEAAMRALVLVLCFMAVGRCGEVAFLEWSLIDWDLAFGLVILTWRDVKNSKDKPVPLLPDAKTWTLDFYFISGFAAVLGMFNVRASSSSSSSEGDEGPRFLFEQLKGLTGSGSVANKISGFLSDMTNPMSKSKFRASMPKYSAEYFGTDNNITSHSCRHGALDEMEANGVYESNASDLSGHAPGSEVKKTSTSTFGTTYHKATKSSTAIGKLFIQANFSFLK